ncbi:hypothetical protein [Kutzneria buriramensis]|uniref:Uncharacterized protein n=1 Tax=Kutzneria buriramensis TaxID=1045776 RepID=A0A3E0HJD0_9PSEU|nr:hypothetical protein [Kutzneria buriramensis]REH46175.1 hypothetical protein BCF44_107308 [Kutzneria buriramensis]
MRRLFRRRGQLLVALVTVMAGVLLSAVPAAATPSAVDVWMQDNPSDNASEPSLPVPPPWWGPDVFSSPDIWVCPTSNPTCTTDTNPANGSLAYVHVRLHRREGAQGNVSGRLQLFYTTMGTSAWWDSPTSTVDDWQDISGTPGVFTVVPPSGTEVIIPWTVPTAPTHFCLLARWDSATDPMTFPEGPTTSQNTWFNNNIAWHNVNTVQLFPLKPVRVPIMIGNPWPDPTNIDLALFPVGQPFVGGGKVIVDLGPELAARWRKTGQHGVGVAPVGDTQVQILDPKQALIQGLPLNGRERLETDLELTAGDRQVGGQFLLREVQLDSQHQDAGGVDHRINVGK